MARTRRGGVARSLSPELLAAASPVEGRAPAAADGRGGPRPGIALCLSGGGYRAMLFHLGALWRLNECGYLPRLAQVSSVSGGSIAAGALGLAWGALAFDGRGVAARFAEGVAAPLRALAGRTIDLPAILGGCWRPGGIAARVAAGYRAHLFGGATLADLPDAPVFVINAANLQSGALWRFTKGYMADYRVGLIRRPHLDLATAVAASSAFPPFLSPLRLRLRAADYAPVPAAEARVTDLHRPPFTTDVRLSDGGVYDNLGLETAWKNWRTILISDGGRKLDPAPRPWSLWPLQTLRALALIDNQVRSRRKAQAVASFKLRRAILAAGEDPDGPIARQVARAGAYWHLADDIGRYQLPGLLPCPPRATAALAALPTRLAALDERTQERLINWGYAACDAHLRLWVDRALPPPAAFPYPGGVG